MAMISKNFKVKTSNKNRPNSFLIGVGNTTYFILDHQLN